MPLITAAQKAIANILDFLLLVIVITFPVCLFKSARL